MGAGGRPGSPVQPLEGASTTAMVIRVSDNNSRFDVARSDDGNAEADPYMGAR